MWIRNKLGHMALVLVILGAIFIRVCSSPGSPAIVDANKNVYVISQEGNVYGTIATFLDKAVENKVDNFILFVHGRGNHPKKAFDKKLIYGLEKDYSAKVMMFHWCSCSSWFGYPEDQARFAAKYLYGVLQSIKKYRNAKKTNMKFTLLTHSMGSIVLEETLLKFYKRPLGKLFDTLVINAPCSEGKNHVSWVDKIDFANEVYIVFNKNDVVLGSAGLQTGARRLGRGLENRRGQKFVLANNVLYIDVTKTGVNHRYYLGNSPQSHLGKFFHLVLNGEVAKLVKGDNVVEIVRDKVYVLKK
ncbi:alpha/beta hydrolase [Candidatus Uabimicrobium amorphum]|uniref:DUF676 domain-containing protein n=1 Tax=Uabimicrobium amorphum TaxID=2596890 RepID=A0A5S9F4J4_UABAM|nr:alpha/beta hydrolase [Candidatus Uabimicrobium amorphum]BBM85865.1 hypothetical protein UABAM_04244 [Candidatus Uabimicrobium amorphum]